MLVRHPWRQAISALAAKDVGRPKKCVKRLQMSARPKKQQSPNARYPKEDWRQPCQRNADKPSEEVQIGSELPAQHR